MLETWDRSLGGEDPLEKGTATHSSILAWRIPWTEDVEHLIMYLLGICISSLEKCPFKFLVHFLKIGLFVILLLTWKNSLYVLNTNLYQIHDFQIFSHSVGCVFTFLIVSFEGQKSFCLYCPVNLFLSFVVYDFDIQETIA